MNQSQIDLFVNMGIDPTNHHFVLSTILANPWAIANNLGVESTVRLAAELAGLADKDRLAAMLAEPTKPVQCTGAILDKPWLQHRGGVVRPIWKGDQVKIKESTKELTVDEVVDVEQAYHNESPPYLFVRASNQVVSKVEVSKVERI